MQKKLILVLLALALMLAACMPSQEQIGQIFQSAQETALAQVTVVPAETQNIDEIVQATFQALTAQAPAATPAPGNAGTGGISGTLSYPSEGIPPQVVVAFDTKTNAYYWVITQQDQTTYQIDNLPVGTYYVVAYVLPDGKLVGAYDQFYLCGLNQGCNDFSLVEVPVTAGAVTPNINPGNWYGGTELYPAMPKIEGLPAVESQAAASGGITGQLNYPSNFIPSLAVVAYAANDLNVYYYVITNENSSTYQIDNLPPGNYYVVAYVIGGGLEAGYSQAVPCGLSAECTDHTLIPVAVNGGQVTSGANPQDWYAPPGTYPAYPLP